MAEIANAGDRQWHSNRQSHTATARTAVKAPAIDLDALPKASMQFVEPMLAKLTSALPEGPQWQYEVKWDGYRALAIRDAKLRLLSRRNNSLNTRFATVAKALEAIEPGTILDGEVVAVDAQGRPSFNVLQNYRQGKPVFYYAFDLLAYRLLVKGRSGQQFFWPLKHYDYRIVLWRWAPVNKESGRKSFG